MQHVMYSHLQLPDRLCCSAALDPDKFICQDNVDVASDQMMCWGCMAPLARSFKSSVLCQYACHQDSLKARMGFLESTFYKRQRQQSWCALFASFKQCSIAPSSPEVVLSCTHAFHQCITRLWQAGALVGPPWSKRENGFIVTETCHGGTRLYYEPHCDHDQQSLAAADTDSVDVVITPASSQVLLGYPLVSLPCPYIDDLCVVCVRDNNRAGQHGLLAIISCSPDFCIRTRVT